MKWTIVKSEFILKWKWTEAYSKCVQLSPQLAALFARERLHNPVAEIDASFYWSSTIACRKTCIKMYSKSFQKHARRVNHYTSLHTECI